MVRFLGPFGLLGAQKQQNMGFWGNFGKAWIPIEYCNFEAIIIEILSFEVIKVVQSLVLSGFELTSKVFRSIGIAKSLKTAKYGKNDEKMVIPPSGGYGAQSVTGGGELNVHPLDKILKMWLDHVRSSWNFNSKKYGYRGVFPEIFSPLARVFVVNKGSSIYFIF